ncbi:uncharacterized protein F5Z01DRAFT_687352 [Emericellopsis atlantica]|uniref:Uncharacterized protein n=1 Tax=Emericellopsis atlantica TaxID=2614577 RepID=A0A9P7ZMP3_9HYPO|nr:uncharacterized protein F5Z01DRAFT_687352 [Emericellopsis atlantica]KAG9254537.1 hypothetical protein F5Z01DRAFT_687352 [Emericellopsis atlantica]
MSPGPFDARVKRSRCSACASSHLKVCTYLHARLCRQRATIQVDQAKVQTVSSFSTKRRSPWTPKRERLTSPLPMLPLSSNTSRHLYYFQVFVERNTFVAGSASYGTDVAILLGTESGHFLVNAVMALGALEASRLHGPTRKMDSVAALQAYSSSLASLRQTMAHSPSPSRIHVLWATLFLGLFELMQNETGDGWLLHMTHGTANALQAAGPLACQSGLGRSFFLQARVFETSRALLLNKPTFLSNPDFEIDATRLNGSSLNHLLNIIVQCSQLRVRTGQFIEANNPLTELGDLQEDALGLAAEGFRLRLALESWRAGRTEIQSCENVQTHDAASHKAVLSKIFFAAISIYLSGVFDYEILHWRHWGILVSTITEDQVQEHVRTILALTALALERSNLSPLLFLFPLRIAGARSCQPWQRERVLQLLARVGASFAVAGAFQMELGKNRPPEIEGIARKGRTERDPVFSTGCGRLWWFES